MTGSLSAFASGFLLGAGLIIAIGAQNAFILRQGLKGQFVFVLCLICSLSDAILIAAGVAGLGTFIARSPQLIGLVTVGGVIFLLFYGLRAAVGIFRTERLDPAKSGNGDLGRAIMTCLALTFLNPHVYLDTVLLVGGISGTFAGDDRIAFAMGAVSASFVWFFALGYGAQLLAPVFARPLAWRVLDGAVALIMWALAASLLAGMNNV